MAEAERADVRQRRNQEQEEAKVMQASAPDYWVQMRAAWDLSG